MRFLIVLLLALVCSGSLRADTTAEKQLKTFIKTARIAAAKLPPATDTVEAPPRTRPAQANLTTLLDYLERQPAPFTENTQNSVSQISVMLAAFPKVKKAGDAFIDTLTAERRERVTRYRAEVDALLVKSSQACLAATKPADLDEPLKALAPYQRQDEQSRRGIVDYTAQQRAAQMFQFVTRWQDYMGALQSGDADRATQALWELRTLVDPTLIPRSRLFALPSKTGDTPATSAITTGATSPEEAWLPVLARLEKTANLDDLGSIAEDLGRILKANPEHRYPREIWNTITGLVGDRKNLASGQVNIDLFSRNTRLSALADNPWCSSEAFVVLDRLSAQLRDETLQVIFKDSGLPPAKNEPIDAYILRVAQASAAAENWEYTLRTLEFCRAVFPTAAPAWLDREMQSCTTYVSARRLDEAQQLPQAILAYQDALRATGLLTPVKLITARLAEITKNNPEARDAAARLPRAIFMPTGLNMQDRFNRPQIETPCTYLVPRTERPFTR